MDKGIMIEYEFIELMDQMVQFMDTYEISRANSVLVLKTLLEAEKSPIYEKIFKQIDTSYYSDIIEECQDQIEATSFTFEEESESNNSNNKSEGKDQSGSKNEEKDKDGFRFVCHYQDYTAEVIFDYDMINVLQNLLSLAKDGQALNIYSFTQCLISNMPTEILKIFRCFGIDIATLKKDLAYAKAFELPAELKDFVKILNAKFENSDCDISGRDKECALVWQTLQKRTKRNVVLVGDPGVGKTSIVEKITNDIVKGNCPKEFKDAKVLSLDVGASIAGTMYRGQAEERYAFLVQYLEENPNVILFIDEIHLIRGAGACKEGEADLSNALKPILAGDNVRIIGATTTDEYNKYFSADGAIKRRFRPIEVAEPKFSEVYPMLKKSIETLSKYHGVRISKSMIDFIILNSACFDYETKNPDRTKDLIDLSMVIAKQDGKKVVDKESVLANFKYKIEQFSKMEESTKKATAYHEAGHCIVMKCSEHLKKNHLVQAVSIMPTDNYLGITVWEDNDSVTISPTLEYYIDSIASDLAGRIAESMFTGRINAGARSDLKSATETAKKVVTEFGLTDFCTNRVYIADFNTQKSKEDITTEISKLIDKATRRATELLNANRGSLKSLVNLLMKNGIVGTKELEKIFSSELVTH